jgi:signal transduction histidine kinase
MKRQTVKTRIFIANAWMIFVTIALVGLINIGVIKLYWESIEQEWQLSMQTMAATADMGHLLKQWTVHQQSFYVLLLVDILVCAGIWIVVSLFFTGKLASQIMKPLHALEQGAQRIRDNDLTQDIIYHGEEEFEDICHAFNQMQAHILAEREKNKAYETSRTEMIAGISHDLRTPLTAIRGSIKGILDGVVKGEQQNKFLQMAYRRTEEMNKLLTQLFELSKLETGNMPLHLQKTNLFDWVSTYIEEKREQGDSVEWIEELSQDTGSVRIDREQMHRIFDNLLENSRKYAEVQPIQISISGKETEQEVLLRFADNGQGVPEEKLASIFEEFYRTDASRKKKEGNGLGLYIVKNLIELMGGQVWAKNEAGLAIYIQLPKGE